MKEAQSVKAMKVGKQEPARVRFQQSQTWIVKEREAIQDYLTDDVPDCEVEAATCYEFARESTSFRYAATKFHEGKEHELCGPNTAKDQPADYNFQISQWPWRAIWTCKSFPLAPWTLLKPEEKEEISDHFQGMMRPCVTRPFNTLDVEALTGMKVVKALQELADETRKKGHRDWREKPVIASVHNDQLPDVEHIVVTINYRGGKDALIKGFKSWLETNRAEALGRFKAAMLTRGEPGTLDWFKTALKQLTAARLRVTLGLKEAKAWTRRNHKHTDDGRTRPFFRQKVKGKARKGGPLFEESREWENAVTKSLSVMEILWRDGFS